MFCLLASLFFTKERSVCYLILINIYICIYLTWTFFKFSCLVCSRDNGGSNLLKMGESNMKTKRGRTICPAAHPSISSNHQLLSIFYSIHGLNKEAKATASYMHLQDFFCFVFSYHSSYTKVETELDSC